MSALFWIFAKTAVLTFGGGYAMVALFQNEIVVRHDLMSADAFANLAALAQVTPGPVGLNSATYIGVEHGGLSGAFSASLGVVLPSFLIALVAAAMFSRVKNAEWMRPLMRGVRPCVIGVIAAAVVFFADTSLFTSPLTDMLRGGSVGVCWQGVAVFLAVVAMRWKWQRLSPVWSIMLSMFLGWVLFL